MTRWQIREIYLHPRDDKGRLINPLSPEPLSYEQRFRRSYEDRGMPPEWIEKKWREYMAGEGAKAKEREFNALVYGRV